MVRCCDGTVIDQEFNTRMNISLLPGRLVLVIPGEEGRLFLQSVNEAELRKIAYLQIIEDFNGSCRVVEEFPYRQKVEAEQRLLAFQSKYPGRYRLVIDKRDEY